MKNPAHRIHAIRFLVEYSKTIRQDAQIDHCLIQLSAPDLEIAEFNEYLEVLQNRIINIGKEKYGFKKDGSSKYLSEPTVKKVIIAIKNNDDINSLKLALSKAASESSNRGKLLKTLYKLVQSLNDPTLIHSLKLANDAANKYAEAQIAILERDKTILQQNEASAMLTKEHDEKNTIIDELEKELHDSKATSLASNTAYSLEIDSLKKNIETLSAAVESFKNIDSCLENIHINITEFEETLNNKSNEISNILTNFNLSYNNASSMLIIIQEKMRNHADKITETVAEIQEIVSQSNPVYIISQQNQLTLLMSEFGTLQTAFTLLNENMNEFSSSQEKLIASLNGIFDNIFSRFDALGIRSEVPNQVKITIEAGNKIALASSQSKPTAASRSDSNNITVSESATPTTTKVFQTSLPPGDAIEVARPTTHSKNPAFLAQILSQAAKVNPQKKPDTSAAANNQAAKLNPPKKSDTGAFGLTHFFNAQLNKKFSLINNAKHNADTESSVSSAWSR